MWYFKRRSCYDGCDSTNGPVIFVVWIGDFVKDIQNAIINQIIEFIQFNLTHIGDVN